MDRHKKYTQMFGADPRAKGPGTSGSKVPVLGSVVSSDNGQDTNSSVLQELSVYDMPEDPDFPSELRVGLLPVSQPLPAYGGSENGSSMLFHQLIFGSNSSGDTHASVMNMNSQNPAQNVPSPGPDMIKSEPFSPRRPHFPFGSPQHSLVDPQTDPSYSTFTNIIEAVPDPLVFPSPRDMAPGEPQPGPSTGPAPASSNPFSVDTSLISSVPMLQQASELQDLGLTVYNQTDLEEGIIAQVDKAIGDQEQQRLRNILEKDQKVAADELMAAKAEVAKMNKVLEMYEPQKANKEVSRRLMAVNQQKENKLKQIKKLKAKLKSILIKLTGSEEGLDEEDEVGTSHDGAGHSALEQALGGNKGESEYERMIRLGEMTPFGTVMGFDDPVLSAHRPKKPKELPKPKTLTSGNSEFDDFLRGQQEKAINKSKKKSVMKRCATESSAMLTEIKIKKEREDQSAVCKHEQSVENNSANAKSKKNLTVKHKSKHRRHREENLRKIKSEPNMASENHSQSSSNSSDSMVDNNSGVELGRDGTCNLYDNRDTRVYRSKEQDFSGAKSHRMRNDRLPHNFDEDGDGSDVEVGDEDYDEDVYGRNEDREYRPEDSEQDIESNGEDESPQTMKKSRLKHIPPVYDEVDAVKGLRRTVAKGRRICRDDSTMEYYQRRLGLLAKERLKEKKRRITAGEAESDSGSDMEFDRGFMVPGRIWNKLYRYQKTGVRWLWELHCQQAGGIVGDEMGLGKTIQIIAFLTGLRESKLRDRGVNGKYSGLGPTIIITPATVMHQWVKEFQKWRPSFRVAILHSSGSYTSSEAELVFDIVRSGGVLLTAFSTVVIHQDLLHEYDWHYVILDEGHKIRNPDAKVTLACKTFRTCHRLILTGSPMQNNLKELWSLFDFVFPGKLGTLPDFMAHFSVPIVQGGYSNATDIQVQTAYKCACVLRDTINPYLLRRMKSDVQSSIQLPSKNEQVLFCRLTEHQRDVYKEYLDSRECKEILDRNFMVFPGLITLRKVCNHPDISTGGPKVFDPELLASNNPCLEYGYWKRSGKLIVVESLLKLWKQQGHRVLLFSQSRMMLDILEGFVKTQGYTYMRMDGGTTIVSRQPLIEKYNEDQTIFVFLLTTRVGGLGVNLTGANRVIIYDPDWNPSTDTQARERAWRIGQTREVTIYRLLTTGTIEEKIYHRQIFKQFLANRVLKDPKQRRFFKSNDLYDLFTLGDDDLKNGTETSAIFAGTGTDVTVKTKHRKRSKHHKLESSRRVNRFDLIREKAKEIEKEVAYSSEDEFKPESDDVTVKSEPRDETTADERLEKMRALAKQLSQKLSGALNGESVSGTGGTNTGVPSAEPSTSTSVLDPTPTKKCKKNKKDKKKKKKQKEDAELEGEKISYLDRHRVYHKQEEEEDGHKASDDYVLGKLLKKKGVHSALQHDKIMMSSDPDYSLVEAEASRVARDAVKALKRSRAQCLRADAGMPTWTGQSGALRGTAPPKPRFGKKKNSLLAPSVGSETTKDKGKAHNTSSPKSKPKEENHFDGSLAGNVKTSGVSAASKDGTPSIMSSQELMTRMKARNHFKDRPTEVEDADDSLGDGISRTRGSDMDPESMELMTDIRNCVAFGCAIDGQASTQELLDHFERKLPSKDSAKFKAMLKNICDFHRRDGIGVWRLKQEFR